MHDCDIWNLYHCFMETDIVLTSKKEGETGNITVTFGVATNRQCDTSVGAVITRGASKQLGIRERHGSVERDAKKNEIKNLLRECSKAKHGS